MSTRDDGSASRPPTAGPTWSRRWLLAGAAAVLALVLGLLLLTGRGDGAATTGTDRAAPSTAAATDAAPPTTAPPLPTPQPTPLPTGATEDVDSPPPTLPEVPLDAVATVGNGVTATLPAVEAIEGTAVGPGNIAGPAVRVTVRLTNGTGAAVSLSGVAVNLYFGPDRTPAPPLDDPSARPVTGVLEAGASAEGVYVFTVPAGDRDRVTVEVGYEAGAPLLLFTGAVP